MEFIHQSYEPGETIAAIATPPGEGGVAMIRISGKQALHVAAKIFSGDVFKYKTHTAHYGNILNEKKEVIDDVLLMPMLGSRSYTGEDTVEIFCHGGSLITRRVLEVVLHAGARPALPGEFTFKAFINGKLDLAQAEAVQELIGAKNEKALEVAESQLKGALSQKIRAFQKKITGIAAILEAWVDFPEEGLEFATTEELISDLHEVSLEMQKLYNTFHEGKIVRDGISLCLAGCPNAGKSSLMNALLEKERAIVSHIPGTTRDVLEDFLYLNGLNFRIMDTAGIRETNESIEKEGIRRSKQAMAEADLILLVLDSSKGIGESEMQILNDAPPEKTIAIWNKIDLAKATSAKLNLPNVVEISAKHRLGLSCLKEMIDHVIWKNGPPSREEVVLTSARHKEALKQSMDSISTVIAGLQQKISPEFLTFDMRQSLYELGKIIGTNIGEDVLSAIFSQFCIGK